jgi:Ni/Co efflux regulator RcnB
MTKSRTIITAVILSVAIAASAPAFAKKPEVPGNSENQASSQGSRPTSADTDYDARASRAYFNQDRRTIIRSYYAKEPQSSNCPPGLAKKNNGCLPPGLAKKWRKGETLPGDVVYYDLPGALVEQLGNAPRDARVVQIDSDVLLINTATGMVLDALDLQE